MLVFEWSWLFLLIPLPILLRLFIKPVKQVREQALQVPFLRDFNDAPATSRANNFSWLIMLLSIIAWLALVTAVARPVMVGESISLPVKGRNIMLAIDLSGSMRERDYRVGNQWVDRLTATKFVAGEFIQRRKGDRIGLILFGDQAYLQAPLTFDRETIKKLLDESALGLAGQKTAIGDAIGLGIKRLRDQDDNEHVLILLTDGENTAGNVGVYEAAEVAAQQNIKIYTVGIGADSSQSGFFQRSSLDEDTLKKIASMTKGKYFRARDTVEFQRIYEELDRLEPIVREQEQWRPRIDLFYLPLAMSLLLFGLAIVLRNRSL
ncbi:MAG TPA: VWA domain-containing protein [Leucothrix mucor]|uniref:VWA domain-containing protein n=1 Tax=Leucothrix mucor TaxID=45248 RepID=A0A7V2T0L0_LEUMU|nr:VWA domain-containing protein [Leucothrix mucor]